MSVNENDLFVWLNANAAGYQSEYADTAARLTKDLRCYFANRGCKEPDELTNEVFLRLTRRLEEGEPFDSGADEARMKIVYGIARNVLWEWGRRRKREPTCQINEGRQLAVPQTDLAREECLQLLQEIFRSNLSQMSSEEQELLYRHDLDPDYAPTLARLAKEKAKMPGAMRQKIHRARVRFRNLLLASEGSLADLRRCFGLRLKKT